ncbi:SLC13 family permease [Lunatimonas salinarum]|uniref:SLC13 family permease n=1 Tax=Lunatimonas salinarum TaxID=1774590 RepID=UPI001ADEF0F2|nr:DASS family sodium-coupled anion symporter [Lunatimonas salinarum]
MHVSKVGIWLAPMIFGGILLASFAGLVEPSDGIRVIALAAWMVTWWVSEAVPIPVTALLPIVAFPLLGIFDMRGATLPYADPVIYLFMGGFIIALAMEKNRLHLRIALNLIRVTGTKANGIIAGFYLATAFLSMWISNTATAVMMLPIAMSIVQLIVTANPDMGDHKGFVHFSFTLMLGIAYAANIGGVITLIGTPPNVVLVGLMDQFYGFSLDFNRWLLIGLPVGGVMLLMMYVFLVRVLYPNGLGQIAGSDHVIQEQLRNLGPISKAEVRVSLVLVATALCWILREPLNLLFQTTLLNDTIIAMTGGICMFLVPNGAGSDAKLLDWKSMKELPWGVLLLFGGGMSLAKGMEAAGIIQAIGAYVAGTSALSLAWLILGLILVCLFLTELMSNVALVTIFLPVVFGIADGMGEEVLPFVIPITMASSFAFMLPISTPPNAILFSSGMISIKEMMKVGIWLNLMAVLLLWLVSLSLVRWVF